MFIDYRFIRSVSDYQPYLLRRPTKKNKTEALNELKIITVDTGLWSVVI